MIKTESKKLKSTEKQNRSRHSGYVALIGRTNAGKSTFLNSIMEAKVAIVSDKPQTTRKRILGIKTTSAGQAVFFDCPGVHKPHFKLNQRMMKEVSDALLDSDLILYFLEMKDNRKDEFILEMLKNAAKPTFLLLNKIDRFPHGRILERIQQFKDDFHWSEIVPISALKGTNLDRIESLIFQYLPEGEDIFPAEEWTRQSEKFYISELIREKLLGFIRDELPYITTVKIEGIEDKERIVVIQAEIYVETPSQKKILVGKKGQLVKDIGQNARRELEDYFEKQVYIELYIRVKPGWRNSPQFFKDIFE